jgi:hypothetical protein
MADGAYGQIPGTETLPPARVASIRAMQQRVQARRDTMTARLMRETYARPALVPAMTWLDDDAPAAPLAVLTERRSGGSVTVAIRPRGKEPAFVWVVQTRRADGWHTEIVPGSAREWVVGSPSEGSEAPEAVWVSAVDRAGNQSRPIRATRSLASTTAFSRLSQRLPRPHIDRNFFRPPSLPEHLDEASGRARAERAGLEF